MVNHIGTKEEFSTRTKPDLSALSVALQPAEQSAEVAPAYPLLVAHSITSFVNSVKPLTWPWRLALVSDKRQPICLTSCQDRGTLFCTISLAKT